MGVQFNNKNEVADYTNVSQFEYGESAYECGFFSVYLNKAAGQPGHGSMHDAEWIDQQADVAYTRYDGLNLSTNEYGMTIFQLYALLGESGQRYQAFPPTQDMIKAWINLVGASVVVTVDEVSVFDKEVGAVPYAWQPTGTHIITISGVDQKGNYLVRDTANIGPDGVRPGPRTYDAKKLVIHQATALLFPWLPSVPATYNPLKQPSVYPTRKQYTIQAGDTLSSIAADHATSVAEILQDNISVLDEKAREYGYASSHDGWFIFPGTLLTWG